MLALALALWANQKKKKKEIYGPYPDHRFRLESGIWFV
jgi:hypothetical protein